MSLSHVTPGEPATDYEWRGVWTVAGGKSAPLSIGVRSVAIQEITWGILWPVEGVQIIGDVSDPIVGSAGGEIRIKSPWFTDQVVTLLGYMGGEWRVEIDGLALERVNCISYSWSYEELRLYVNDALIYTGGANSGSGTGYDHRQNRCRMQAWSEYNPDITCNPGACPLPPGSILPGSRLRGGYRRDRGSGYETDAVLIDPTGYITPLAVPGCPTCDCIPPPATIHGADSWDIEVLGERLFVRDADETSKDCKCLDGSSGGTVTEHRIDEDFRDDAAYVHVVGIHHGITLRRIEQKTCCNCACPPFADEICRLAETDMVSTYTYCESLRSSSGWIKRVYCWEGFVICPDPPGPDPRCGSDAEDAFCAFDCYVRVSWPVDACADCEDPSLDVSRAWGHIRAAVCGGSIWFAWAPHSSPGAFTSRDTGIGADTACVRFEHGVGGERISLSYVVGEELRYRYSEDEGQSWESPVTIQTGVHDATHEIGRDGRRIFLYTVGSGPYDLLAQVWSAQDDVLIAETLVDTDVDPTGLDSREYPSADGGWLLGLTYRKAGALIYVTSPDGVNFS